MASDVSSTYLRALGIPDARLTATSLKARGTTGDDSKYTESGPQAGVPAAVQASGLVLEANGVPSQEAHVLITAHRAGSPVNEGAGFIWSDQTLTTPVDMGWDAPNLVTGFETLLYTSTAVHYTPTPVVLLLQSGNLITVSRQDTSGLVPLIPHYYTTKTSTWAALSAINLEDAAPQGGCALLQLPSGRVLLYVQTVGNDQVDCLYSDNDGTSWAYYARRVLDVVPAVADIQRLSAEYNGGEVLLIVEWHTGAAALKAAVYGSRNLGITFTQTEDEWATLLTEGPESFRIVPASSGAGFVVGYASQLGGSAVYYTRRFPSAFTAADATTAVQIGDGPSAGVYSSLALFRADDDILYSIRHARTNTAIGEIKRSLDDGLSWDVYGHNSHALSLDPASIADRLEYWDAAMVGGRVALVTRWLASVADEDAMSIAVVYLGGHSSHTAPTRGGNTQYDDTDQVSFNAVGAGTTLGGLWLPIELPNNTGWASSVTGTADLVSPGALGLTTTSNVAYYSRTRSGANLSNFGEVCLQVDSGGSTSSSTVCCYIQIGDGASVYYLLIIRFSTTGINVWDGHGAASLASASVDMTTPMIVRWAYDGATGKVSVWYARPGHVRSWTRLTVDGDGLTDSGGVSNNILYFGHVFSSTSASKWFWVGYRDILAGAGVWGPSTSSFGAAWSSPADLHPRSFATTPQIVYDDIRIAAKSGPAKLGDSWTVKQDAAYPALNMLWPVNPSPQAAHRTTSDESEVLYTFQLDGLAAGAGTLGSTSIFCHLEGINFRLCHLESSTDGAAWTTQLSLDAGTDFVTSLEQTRSGEIFAPTKGGNAFTAGRYINAGEFVGGTLKLSGGELREIAENTSGAWTSQTAAIPYFRALKVVNGDPTTGAVEIWAPRVLAYKHEVTTQHRHWRLRIPASEATAQDYIKIGQLTFGRVHTFGMQYGRGWSVSVEPQTDLQTLRSGSTRARKLGPALRQVEIGWTDGSDATQVQTASPVPDYISGSSSGVPLASRGDELRALAGQLAQQGGAASPVVFMPKVLRGTGTQQTTDRELMLYGRIESPASRSNVVGDEGVSELDRGDTITIREIG